MIKTFKHKGLKLFWETGRKSGIVTTHERRLKIILQLLNAANIPKDMNLPGMRFHKLEHDLKGFYSVTVSGNWRVIFQFEGNDAVLIDYVDYH